MALIDRMVVCLSSCVQRQFWTRLSVVPLGNERWIERYQAALLPLSLKHADNGVNRSYKCSNLLFISLTIYMLILGRLSFFRWQLGSNIHCVRSYNYNRVVVIFMLIMWQRNEVQHHLTVSIFKVEHPAWIWLMENRIKRWAVGHVDHHTHTRLKKSSWTAASASAVDLNDHMHHRHTTLMSVLMMCRARWTTEHTWHMLRLLLLFNDLA